MEDYLDLKFSAWKTNDFDFVIFPLTFMSSDVTELRMFVDLKAVAVTK